jgi:multidrug efflux system membrane fusion protein
MTMRVWKSTVSLLVVAAATAGVVGFMFPGVWSGARMTPALAEQQAQPPAAKPRAMPVPVFRVAKRTVPVYLEYVGTTEAIRSVTLQAKVNGYLASQNVQDGADVAAGDLIYKIDPRDYQAALDQIKAQYQRDIAASQYAKSTQSRNALLSKQGWLDKDTNDQKTSQMHQAEATLLADQAQIRSAELMLGYTEIRAPFAGRLGKSLVHEGALITPQQTELNTLVQMNPIYATFNPSETDLEQIQKYRKQGDLAVDVMLGDDTQPSYSGKLTFLDNTVDRTTGTITARATIENPKEELLPGQYVRVRVHLTDEPDALVVPQIALGSSQLGRFVYVIGASGTAEQKFVQTGALIGDRVVIEKGLKEGDQVITGNLQKIGPGAPVEAAPIAMNSGT